MLDQLGSTPLIEKVGQSWELAPYHDMYIACVLFYVN